MNLSTRQISQIIKISRENLTLSPEEIISSMIEMNCVGKLGEFFSKKVFKKQRNQRPMPYDILFNSCLVHGQQVEAILSLSRKREHVRVRQQYALISTLFKYSLAVIGDEINRNHETVFFGKNRALDYCRNEPEYFQEVMNIIDKFPNYKSLLMERLGNN